MSSDPRLSDLSDAEFDALIEGHIERTASGAGDLPADVFIDLLFSGRQHRVHRRSRCRSRCTAIASKSRRIARAAMSSCRGMRCSSGAGGWCSASLSTRSEHGSPVP